MGPKGGLSIESGTYRRVLADITIASKLRTMVIRTHPRLSYLFARFVHTYRYGLGSDANDIGGGCCNEDAPVVAAAMARQVKTKGEDGNGNGNGSHKV
jgi:hypothetical protein